MMTVVFGKKLGQALFKNLYGLNYQAIHVGISLFFFLFYILVGGYLIKANYFNMDLANLFYEDQKLLPFFTASSMFAALILISEIIRITDKKFRENGLNSKDALHSSTLITLEYFFTFVPLLYISIRDFENFNRSFALMGSLFLLLFYVNINMFLYLDLRKQQYNNFKKIRLVLSGLLQLVALTAAPILFFLEYRNDGLFFINQYNSTAFFLGFLGMYPAKLLGYDTEFGSKRAYKRSWFKFVFLSHSLKIVGYNLPIVVYLLVQDESKAIYISVLLVIIFLSILGCETAMVLLPWSNISEKSITHDWAAMLKKMLRRYTLWLKV
ncbi:MAG: hypothetical protein E7E18_08385 [Eubacterium sp.]|nr:hypothetical protein [Eubacterium sp.]